MTFSSNSNDFLFLKPLYNDYIFILEKFHVDISLDKEDMEEEGGREGVLGRQAPEDKTAVWIRLM